MMGDKLVLFVAEPRKGWAAVAHNNNNWKIYLKAANLKFFSFFAALHGCNMGATEANEIFYWSSQADQGSFRYL